MIDGIAIVSKLIQGHPEYGCSVNAGKSLTNFDVTINSRKVPRLSGSKYFPFCGNGIDVETLDVIKDFTRMEGSRIVPIPFLSDQGIVNSLTVERTQTPGKAFIVKTLKLNSIFMVLTTVH